MICTYSEYVEKKIYVPSTKLIANCKNYSDNNGIAVCIICSTGYIPSTDGKCYLSSTQLFCLQMKGSLACNKCQTDYVIINGSCNKASIENCIKYNNSPSSTK